MSENWVRACATDDIDEEDVIRFDHDGQTFAVYNTPSGFYATHGMCTHEEQHLEDGLVIDDVIECPLHQGRFHIPTGEAKGAPVCVNLKTYPVRVDGEDIYINTAG
ncbi:non-heme iron oxygenase ferredoxin subunit [Coralliovum pocilloporae]|uniref:non-heme iron oxygenase ferredoxin subunit n=1 Tax=Coralliovum pocilloporae TaxID=3066369 RepID=UPI0033075FFE